MARGKLILVIGPTGSGKSTLMRHVIERFPQLRVCNSYTTRARRPDHVENDHYRFISVDEFKQMIDRGEFVEWAEFSGNYYGTRKSDIEECIQEGTVVIKEMEVQGVRQIKRILPKEDILTIFIDAGPWEELVERAVKRDPLSDEELARRKARYEDELTFASEADVVIHNGAGQREKADLAFEAVVEKILTGE